MPYTILNTKKSKLRSFWEKSLFPLLAVFLIVVLDYQFPQVILTRFLCMLVLIIMSSYMKPWGQFFWIVVFSIVVNWVMHNLNFVIYYTWDNPDGLVRSLSFPVVALSTLYTCCKRQELMQSYSCTMNLIRAIPDPIVLSDEDGRILLTNKSMQQLLDLPEDKIKNSSYFTLFSLPYQQGNFVSSYLDRLDNQGNEHIVVDFINHDNIHRSLKVEWIPFKIEGRTLLVSFFSV